MTAKVSLSLSGSEAVILVPNEAIVQKNGSRSVYKMVNGTAQLIPITISGASGVNTIIQGGLVDGDTIVTVGQKQLGVDSKVWIEAVH